MNLLIRALLAIFLMAAGLLTYSEISLRRAGFYGAVAESEYGEFKTDILHLSLLRTKKIEGRRAVVLNSVYSYAYELFVMRCLDWIDSCRADGSTSDYYLVHVPPYFISDFASIPTPLLPLIGSFGDYAEAAVIHDWFYANGDRKGRLHADVVFYQAMKSEKVPFLIRRLMFVAVRAGGLVSWARVKLTGGDYFFASDTAWRSSFHIPALDLPLPEQCLPEKGRRAASYPILRFKKRGDDQAYQIRFGGEEITEGVIDVFLSYENAVFDEFWRPLLSSPECQNAIAWNFEFSRLQDPPKIPKDFGAIADALCTDDNVNEFAHNFWMSSEVRLHYLIRKMPTYEQASYEEIRSNMLDYVKLLNAHCTATGASSNLGSLDLSNLYKE